MKQNRFIYTFLLLAILITSTAWADVHELAEILIKAEGQNQPIPVLSVRYPELDIQTAYEVQKAYVRKWLVNDKIAGFKAGLTSPEIQRKFGVEFPVAGVLFESGKKGDKAVISISDFKTLMIETEIGFMVGRPITRQIEDVSELRWHIKAIMPVIELPDLGYEDLKKLKAVDIIASNVSATQFIVGQEKGLNGLNPNDLTVALSLDGQLVNQGKGSDALGDQWEAALWLVNFLVNQGWEIKPGQILITGVLGKMLPGKPGNYVANYGNLGKIRFEIR
ncbi:MAG TPA: fumarylacetoacetate hydrolase family protein [Thermodesulfobacteriota bacterium]|nr:fumarylacetoacetate hydrolase family protein [Thermodesulfobacteriota bacterium]